MSEHSKSLTIAVASDLHACPATQEASISHLRVGAVDDSPQTNPLLGLKELISNQQLSADMLLLPGDLADKAEPSALRYSWTHLQEVASLLAASYIFATAGNHDVDSRYKYNHFDAKGVLQTLSPRFPLPDEADCDRYWSRHFAIIENSFWRLVVLNSSAFHGGQVSEYEHGRVSPHTLEALRKALAGADRPELNILLCHHHPHQHAELGLGE